MVEDTRQALAGTLDLQMDAGAYVSSYSIETEAGRGASCITYRARDARGNRKIIQEFFPVDTRRLHVWRDERGALACDASDESAFQARLARFRNAKEHLDGYYYDLANAHALHASAQFGEANGTVYAVYPFRKGSDLQTRGRQGIGLNQAAKIMVSLCNAIAPLHDHKSADGEPDALLYLDVKPSNIFLYEIEAQDDLHVCLFDFDTVVRLADAGSATYLSHSRGWAPPEQYEGVVDTSSDIYAIGAVFFWLIAGRQPSNAAWHPADWHAGATDTDVLAAGELPEDVAADQAPDVRDQVLLILEGTVVECAEDRCESVAELAGWFEGLANLTQVNPAIDVAAQRGLAAVNDALASNGAVYVPSALESEGFASPGAAVETVRKSWRAAESNVEAALDEIGRQQLRRDHQAVVSQVLGVVGPSAITLVFLALSLVMSLGDALDVIKGNFALFALISLVIAVIPVMLGVLVDSTYAWVRFKGAYGPPGNDHVDFTLENFQKVAKYGGVDRIVPGEGRYDPTLGHCIYSAGSNMLGALCYIALGFVALFVLPDFVGFVRGLETQAREAVRAIVIVIAVLIPAFITLFHSIESQKMTTATEMVPGKENPDIHDFSRFHEWGNAFHLFWTLSFAIVFAAGLFAYCVAFFRVVDFPLAMNWPILQTLAFVLFINVSPHALRNADLPCIKGAINNSICLALVSLVLAWVPFAPAWPCLIATVVAIASALLAVRLNQGMRLLKQGVRYVGMARAYPFMMMAVALVIAVLLVVATM